MLATLLFLLVAPFQPLIVQARDAAGYDLNAKTIQQVQAASTAATAQATAAQGGGLNGTGTPPSCSWSPGSWDLCITSVVYIFTVGIGSGFAYIAAYFFDWAIALSLNGGIYALTFVSQGWTTARDIANMAFLFILLYIAFKVIFEAETNETVHMLTMVIVVALLVNFSFFLTRLAIDAGNILSIQFYNAIQAPSIASTAAGQAGGVSGTLGNSANASTFINSIGSGGNSKDLTASIMNMLNFQGLFGTYQFNSWYSSQKDATGFMVVVISLSFLYIAAGIMFWLLTVAFVTNGIKFLFRIVILWFLIIAAPLAFVARAVPKFEDYYKQWQSALISHAFYPAAFMFIFLILTNFATQLSCTNANVCGQDSLVGGLFGGLQAANAATPVAAIGIAAANIFIRLGFVIAMLYVGMEASKKFGTIGASAAEHAGNWVGGKMTGAFRTTGNLAARGAGHVYARGVGSMAYDTQEQLKNSRIGNSWLGYRIRKNVLAPMAGSTFGGAKSYTDVMKAKKDEKTERAANLRDVENVQQVKTVSQKIAAGQPISDLEKDRVQSIGEREFGAMKFDDIKAIASVLSEDQAMKKIDKLEHLTEDEKEKIKNTWSEKSKEAPLQKAIKDLTDSIAGNANAIAHVTTARNTNAFIDSGWSAQLKQTLQAQHSTATAAWNQNRNAANHTAMQSAQEALNKYKEFEDNRKKIHPDQAINNGTKGAFKASLIP